MTNSPKKLDVIIVGAGPSGLILAKLFAKTALSFQVIERNDEVGGIWNIDAPNSPMYDSAHFISSKTLSGFVDFPMPEDYPDYPSHKQLFHYIKSYADEYDLRQHITFNTSVDSAKQDNDGNWQVSLNNGGQLTAGYLVCANGVTWQPNLVNFEGTFNGEIYHSVKYRSAEAFKNKRVLVVGAGNSGVDIACDASVAADQAYLSVRRGYHFIPKHIMGKPSDVFATEGPKLPHFLEVKVFGFLLNIINGKMESYGLPKPDHKLFESHPIMNTQILHYLGHGDCIAKSDVERLDGDAVIFKDGSREQIDAIVTATGYEHAVPYLEEGTIESKDGRPDLYLNIFSRKHQNLALLGFIEFASAAYENFERMAELIVLDAVSKPEKLAALKTTHRPDLKGGHRYIATERNANYVEVDTYLKHLKKIKKQLGVAAG